MDSVSPHCYKFLTSLPQFAELRMCALSNYIREKPNWWEEVRNEATVEKWRKRALREWEEASRTVIDVRRDEGASSRRLTPTMAKSCYLRITTSFLYLALGRLHAR